MSHPFASFMHERRPRASTTTTSIRSTATSVDFVGRYESLEDDLKLALGRVVANLAITTGVSAQTTTALQFKDGGRHPVQLHLWFRRHDGRRLVQTSLDSATWIAVANFHFTTAGRARCDRATRSPGRFGR